MPKKKKRSAKRLKAFADISSKRWKKTAQEPVVSSPEPESTKEGEDAYVVPSEALVRTMFDFYNKRIVQTRSVPKNEAAEGDPGPEPDLIDLSDTSDEEEDSDSEGEIVDGPYVRVVVNGESVPKRLRVKKRWQRARQSRAVGRKNLKESALAGMRTRGKNGGMKKAINIPSERERNRVMNQDRAQTKREKTAAKREHEKNVALAAQKVLENALKKTSLEERVGVVYDVQRGERMVRCWCRFFFLLSILS